jgi:hypothetical protein
LGDIVARREREGDLIANNWLEAVAKNGLPVVHYRLEQTVGVERLPGIGAHREERL